MAGAIGAACAGGVALVLHELWLDPALVLAFNDGNIEGVLSPIFSYPDSLTRIWDEHFYFGRGDVGVGLAGFAVLETLAGPYGYRRWVTLLVVALVAAVGFWLTRQMGRSRPAACVAGVFLGLCGWTTTGPLSGLLGRPLTLMWAALALGLIERTERAGPRPWRWKLTGYALAGGAIGLAVTETADIGAFFALAFAAWWFLAPDRGRHEWRRQLLLFAVLVAVSGLAAGHMLVKMSSTELASSLAVERGTGGRSAEASWDWATQWSLPASETLSLAVPGFHGASSRSDDAPYWGRLGRTPGWQPGSPGWRHFKLNGYFIGTAAAALLFLLAFEVLLGRALERQERRRAGLALIFIVGTLALAWGRYFIVYRGFHALPFMDAIRNPEKWLGPMALFTAVALGYAADVVIRRMQAKQDRAWARAIDTFGLLAAIALLLLAGACVPGPGDLSADADPASAVRASQHAVMGALLVLAGFALGRRWVASLATEKRAWATAGVLMTLIGGQLLFSLRPYVEVSDPSYLRQPSALLETLDGLEPEGRLKLLPPRQSLLNNWRLTYLASRGDTLFDPVSVRVLPEEEARLFTAFDGRIVDLWRLGSVRWFLGTDQAAAELLQASADFRVVKTLPAEAWDPRLAPEGALLRSPRTRAWAKTPIHLLELTSARPRLEVVEAWTPAQEGDAGDEEVLRLLPSDVGPDPAMENFVHVVPERDWPRVLGAQQALQQSPRRLVEVISRTPTRVEVEAQGPGLLVRTSRFDSRWRVTVDGGPATLHRVNYLFQGVALEPGQHRVVFEFSPPQGPLLLSLVARLGLLVLVFFYFLRWRRTS